MRVIADICKGGKTKDRFVDFTCLPVMAEPQKTSAKQKTECSYAVRAWKGGCPEAAR